jgi:hypothetical protein
VNRTRELNIEDRHMMLQQSIKWLVGNRYLTLLLLILHLTFSPVSQSSANTVPPNVDQFQPRFTRIEARGVDLWMEWTAIPEAAQGYIISWRATGSEDWTDVACSADQHQFHILLPPQDRINNDLEVRVRSNHSFQHRSPWSNARVAIQAPEPVVEHSPAQSTAFPSLLAQLHHLLRLAL